MPGSLRFAISIPQFVADATFDPAGLRAYLARAEARGFDSAWTMEQVLGAAPVLGPIETMTYRRVHAAAAAGLCRVRDPVAQPGSPAKSLSTLDKLSRGGVAREGGH